MTETRKKKELNQLFQKWINLIRTKEAIEFSEDKKLYPAEEYFVKDGFYPGYFSAETKVLFIGRETRYTASYSPTKDRIDYDLTHTFLNNPNKDIYWRRIFYLYYGIKTEGKKEFFEIPYPTELIEKKDYAFSIMNFSKYSNDADNGATANYDLINRALEDSELDKFNFILEEIKILDPDIIITANLWKENGINKKYLDFVFPEESLKFIKTEKNLADLYEYNFNGKIVKLIDTYHFSAAGSDEQNFYKPVMKLLFS